MSLQPLPPHLHTCLPSLPSPQQQLLVGGGAQDGLQSLSHSYRKLWEKMRGWKRLHYLLHLLSPLPPTSGVHPTAVSLPAEVSVLLSLCQLEALLGRWAGADMHCYITMATVRSEDHLMSLYCLISALLL